MIGVKCHVCNEVHELKQDTGFKPKSMGGWRMRYTYFCPKANREFKVYTQGEIISKD
jgi:uncharacterized protein YlaI